MEYRVLQFCLILIFAFLIDENRGWWDTRRRRRRCSPSDCTLSAWSSWGTCSLTCGNGGTQDRHRTILKRQSCGGRCFRLRETRQCNNVCCPIDCVYSWGSWGSCQGSCGTGWKSRNLTVIRNEYCGGMPCPVNQTEKKSCNLPRYKSCLCILDVFIFKIANQLPLFMVS